MRKKDMMQMDFCVNFFLFLTSVDTMQLCENVKNNIQQGSLLGYTHFLI